MDIVMEREKRLASVEPEGATKDFRQTVAERAERDPEFREALVVEREEARVREIAEQVEEVSEKDNADGEPCADCGVVILEHGSDHEWRSAGDAPHIPKPQGCICPWSEADGIAFEDNPYCTIHHPEPQADAPQIPPPPTEDELEAFARKLWCRWVGIPITEPYTKEFTDLLGEVRKMHRDAFTRGLREARRQYGKEGDQNG
jgi:hypothetical protein